MSGERIMPSERKVVLVTRRTRLQDLLLRHHTLAQARFYLSRLDADFSDYQAEQDAYSRSLAKVTAALQRWGRHQVVDRAHLPNLVFAPDDIVVALGQDGLVANAMKYLDGQPLIGINPEPGRWDGVLLPFAADELSRLLPEVAHEQRPLKAVTMAEARLSDGQVLRAVNDLFIGPRSHGSAWYDLRWGDRQETQSSSGVIVATGLGSTAWLKSIVTGARGIAAATRHEGTPAVPAAPATPFAAQPWDARQLTFVVREPFPSRRCGTELVYGQVSAAQGLTLRSRMPEHGVIFSDGMESDFLRFGAGVTATIGIAAQLGRLVV